MLTHRAPTDHATPLLHLPPQMFTHLPATCLLAYYTSLHYAATHATSTLRATLARMTTPLSPLNVLLMSFVMNVRVLMCVLVAMIE